MNLVVNRDNVHTAVRIDVGGTSIAENRQVVMFDPIGDFLERQKCVA